MSDYLDPANEELLKDFFQEAEQQVETLEQNILVLESEPASRDAVDELFRAAHTLKGGAATVQMNEIADLTHAAEDVLDDIREERTAMSAELVDALLSTVDQVKTMLLARQSGQVYDAELTPALAADQTVPLRRRPGRRRQWHRQGLGGSSTVRDSAR